MPIQKGSPNFADLINELADEINITLNDRRKDHYFESIVLIYSFIENILKWLVFAKLLCLKSTKRRREKEIAALRKYCRSLSFYDAHQAALALDLIDLELYKRIGKIRQERNDTVHQFWLYAHRGELFILRKKLEKLAGVASNLVGSFNKLIEEIGIDEILEIQLFLVK